MLKYGSLQNIVQQEQKIALETITALEKKKCTTEKTRLDKEKKMEDKKNYITHLSEFSNWVNIVIEKAVDKNDYIIEKRFKQTKRILSEEKEDNLNKFLSQYITPEQILRTKQPNNKEEDQRQEKNGKFKTGMFLPAA